MDLGGGGWVGGWEGGLGGNPEHSISHGAALAHQRLHRTFAPPLLLLHWAVAALQMSSGSGAANSELRHASHSSRDLLLTWFLSAK